MLPIIRCETFHTYKMYIFTSETSSPVATLAHTMRSVYLCVSCSDSKNIHSYKHAFLSLESVMCGVEKCCGQNVLMRRKEEMRERSQSRQKEACFDGCWLSSGCCGLEFHFNRKTNVRAPGMRTIYELNIRGKRAHQNKVFEAKRTGLLL